MTCAVFPGTVVAAASASAFAATSALRWRCSWMCALRRKMEADHLVMKKTSSRLLFRNIHEMQFN